MSEIKWIKLYTDVFQDDKLRIIDSLIDRDVIIVIWIKLLVQAGKDDKGGIICFDKDTPYTEEMLSKLFARSVKDIKKALKVLVKFKLIKISKSGIITIVNWNKNQNVEAMERARELSKIRMRNKRMRDKEKHEKLKKSIENETLKNESNIRVTNSNNNNKRVTVTTENKNKNKSKKEIKNNIDNNILLKLNRDREANLTVNGSDNYDYDGKELI